MTDPTVPVAGSLSGRIIRACQTHANTCALECPERQVVELGEIASFGNSDVKPAVQQQQQEKR